MQSQTAPTSGQTAPLTSEQLTQQPIPAAKWATRASCRRLPRAVATGIRSFTGSRRRPPKGDESPIIGALTILMEPCSRDVDINRHR